MSSEYFEKDLEKRNAGSESTTAGNEAGKDGSAA
jgi:hypothetical protein